LRVRASEAVIHELLRAQRRPYPLPPRRHHIPRAGLAFQDKTQLVTRHRRKIPLVDDFLSDEIEDTERFRHDPRSARRGVQTARLELLPAIRMKIEDASRPTDKVRQ